ncbi:spectrin beta chain, non-erythrocytic 2-like [Arapaima gigas]
MSRVLTVRDARISRASASSQGEDGLLKSPALPVSGSGGGNGDDVTWRSHAERESREPTMAELRPAAPRGRGLMHAQLQQFTVSADKTLAWLKDNVAMATHICCTASLDGIEAAKRCQAALEEEILSNKARIEVVKKEGRSLVRAHHPGSAKIEEFLGQLEALWEELKRRHQSNVVVLQETEKLSLKATSILKDLNSLETWLQSVERTIRQSSLAGDPESMSVAEQESSLLEKEVSSRGTELRELRQEVEKLHCHQHVHVLQLLARVEEVEEKYRCVLSALTQQSAELQDTRMLTEFLERVELEESQALRGSHDDSLRQPLQSNLGTGSSLTRLPGVGAAIPILESIGDPVEELREAVEMLNDTAREHSLSQDQGIQELQTRYSSLVVRINQQLSRSTALNMDIQEAESNMAVKCEPHCCELEGLWEQQEDLQVEYEVLKEEVEETERTATRLQTLCPDRLHGLQPEAQATLQVWEELGQAVAENRARLQQFTQLRDFFEKYLAMISWTEDTRAHIFSDSAVHYGIEGQEESTSKLDMKIEQKFQEFDDLAAAGQKLIDEQHHLTEMIKERTEELHSMLGWILVRWRAQKQQRHHGKGKADPKGDVIYSEVTVCSPSPQAYLSTLLTAPCATQAAAERTDSDGIGGQPEGSLRDQPSNGYEVMGSIWPSETDTSLPGGVPQGPLAAEESKSPFIVLKEPGAPLRGGTVNLILNIAKTGEAVEAAEVPEPIHRVSTYLHVKENKGASPVYENITLPYLPGNSKGPTSSSSSSCSSSSSSTPKVSSSSLIGSLKSKSMKRKRKEDVRRHTIQRIMGPELQEVTPASSGECHVHSTNTWPLKERKRKGAKEAAVSHGAELLNYVSNPLAKDIDAESTGGVLFAQPALEINQSPPPAEYAKNNCRYLSLGSVLSFDLSKDLRLIPSIPDVITIGPLEPKGPDLPRNDTGLHDPNSRYSHTERHTTMSTFKQTCLPSKRGEDKSKLSPIGKLSVNVDRHQDTAYVSHQKAHFKRNGSSPEQNQTPVSNYPSDLKVKLQPGTSDLQEEASQELDRTTGSLEAGGQVNSKSLIPNAAREEENLTAGTSDPRCSAVPAHHTCPSVHTRIQELNGHQYKKDHITNPRVASSITQLRNQANVGTLNFKGIKYCTEAAHRLSTDVALPRGTVGRAVSLELDCCNEDPMGLKLGAVTAAPDAVHPDHQQFEEEEEELEDIWNQTNGYRQSICSDIMYQTHQAELARSPLGDPRQPSPQGQAVLYRKLVTASAPNLLVAEFKLPPSVQTLLGYSKGQSSGEGKSSSRGDRKSWAAFPQREPPSEQTELVNETASDPVKLPDTEERQKYIYQYKEDELEEEEKEEELKDVNCPKDKSMSLLSVHMDLEGTSCQLAGVDSGREEQQHAVATGGCCITSNGRKPEFQSMEGSLDRKHILQLGGKRAPCRSWTTCHAVLFRQTLCFYQDRKDTLKCSVSGLPLNLTGAECSPAAEYSKRANCFSLRLRDGSEYLLSASSRFLMKKWMLKIQANSGLSEADSPEAASPLGTQDLTLDTSPASRCHGATKCHGPSVRSIPSSPLGQSQVDTAKAKEIVVLTRDISQIPETTKDLPPNLSTREDQHSYYGSLRQAMRQRLSQRVPEPDVQPSSSSFQDGGDCPSSKRRSHSFTSATYQKITPVTLPPGGSSYSVTLFIGDQHSEASSLSNKHDCPQPGGRQREPSLNAPSERSYASLPRQRNKSVFKKFFGKRE